MSVFEQTRLGNGIRVLTAPMPQVSSVACFVMLAAGSRYETPASQGIAHFAEHMFFKGTERRPTARTISTEIEQRSRPAAEACDELFGRFLLHAGVTVLQ